MELNVGYHQRELPYHGHDRLILLPELGRFALFDGASQAMASNIAARTFLNEHAGHQAAETRPTPFLNDVFAKIHQSIQAYQNGVASRFQDIKMHIVTTGTAVGLRELTPVSEPRVVLDYAHAGDSSLWLHDHRSGTTRKLTRDDTLPDLSADVRQWLGSPEHELRHWLGFPLDAGRHTLALISDGVTSEERPPGSVEPAAVGEILAAGETPRAKAEQLIAASTVEDDASAIIIEVQS